MSPARIAVLAIAAVAAIAAALLMRGIMMSRPAEAPIVAEVRDEAPSVSVLAAARDLAVGERIMPGDLVWADWPESAAIPSFVLEASQPNAMEEYEAAVVRAPIAQGEPLLPGRVVRIGDASFMAAMLAPGMRAVAIPISVQRGAGGFILPNDRVDVVLTRETATDEGRAEYITSTILTNVRVLAIDQTFAEIDGQQTVIGSTATLELAPREVELVSQAEALGSVSSGGGLSLALRSLADSVAHADEARAAGLFQAPVQATVQVYRYGGVRRVAVEDTPERTQ